MLFVQFWLVPAARPILAKFLSITRTINPINRVSLSHLNNFYDCAPLHNRLYNYMTNLIACMMLQRSIYSILLSTCPSTFYELIKG